jgi:hypothetical protein
MIKSISGIGIKPLALIVLASVLLLGSCNVKSLSDSGTESKSRLAEGGNGFSVDLYPIARPLWEIFADDLDGDGIPEIIACDVDGIVTVRNPGFPEFLIYDAGALVYQFESADLNNDGIKEIIMSSVDPKIPVIAIDLQGNIIREFSESYGPQRMVAADINQDGNHEIAVSIGNHSAGRGIASGVRLYDNNGKTIWVKNEKVRGFHIGEMVPGKGLHLVIGGPGVHFRIYDKDAELVDNIEINNSLLEHFVLTDINSDGHLEIVASYDAGSTINLVCIKRGIATWDIKCPSQLREDTWDHSAVQTVIACGDFDKNSHGNEIAMIGTNYLFLFDSKGNLLYQNRAGYKENWESWVPDGINPMDVSLWNSKEPQLFLSSSRYRHQAYYKLTYGQKDEFRAFPIPDQEEHLDDIYKSLKNQSSRESRGNQKLKIFMEMHPLLDYAFISSTEEELIEYRKMLDSMETTNLEYLVTWGPNNIMRGHQKDSLTDDQIVERARLFEKTGIPFGYWVSHGCRVWLSDEAIRRSKEVAPNMFRFLLVVENLEVAYSERFINWLKWVDKTLDFCSKHKMNMIFKDKHDSWGLLPADPEISKILFNPKYREVIVPAFSTNQPFHFETQLGGLLGLKLAGLCTEFGISSQYWNWHEWGGYPRGIRDITPTMVCPSDIILRLDLMGLALGATWINLEHGQPYFMEDMKQGLAPMAYRHREIIFELVRKKLLVPGSVPVNVNNAALVRSLHPEIAMAREKKKMIAYPYYDRNIDALRKGFIPAAYLFETYPKYAFPRLAYSSEWNGHTCFPQTPYGWVPVVPQGQSSFQNKSIVTDGEKILIDNIWKDAEIAAPLIEKIFADGAGHIPLLAPGTSMIIHKDPSGEGVYTAILIDPGYLAPTGVETNIFSKTENIIKVTDLVSKEELAIQGNSCEIKIQPGAFRIIKIEFAKRT